MHNRQTKTINEKISNISKIMLLAFITYGAINSSTAIADTWAIMSGNMGQGDSCEGGGHGSCVIAEDVVVTVVPSNHLMVVRDKNNETYPATWNLATMTGSTLVYVWLPSGSPELHINPNGPFYVSFRIGPFGQPCYDTGCFTGLQIQNMGCQWEGINCGTKARGGLYSWRADATGIEQDWVPGPGGWAENEDEDQALYRISGAVTSPTFLCIVDGPSGDYYLPGGGSGYCFNSNETIPVQIVSHWTRNSGALLGSGATAGTIVIPPTVPPEEILTDCEIAAPRDIDFGVIPAGSGETYTGTTQAEIVCNRDSDITAEMIIPGKSGGAFELGGLDGRIGFTASDKPSVVISTNAARATLDITATIGGGTAVPGTYSQSVVLNISYD